MSKPYLVCVSGAPGSGKTTLSKHLVEKIKFIYLDSDSVLQNFWLQNTDNKVYDREKVGIPKLFELVSSLGRDFGISIIVDMAPVEESNLEKLIQVFDIAHIHCKSAHSIKRFYRRETNEKGEEPDWLGPHMEELKEKLLANSMIPNLGVPCIEVDTDNNYNPSISKVVERLNIPTGYRYWNK